MDTSSGRGRPNRAGRPRAREAPVGIKSVEQALDIVDVLARSDRPLSLTELSTRTRMEPSKLHRYLVSLRARGLVRLVEGSGLYDLGPGALALGVQSLARLDDFDILREVADDLSLAYRESSFVYVWTQAGPVLVHNRRPAYALVNLRIGSVVPVVSSASGPIFLTYMEEGITRPILARDAQEEGVDLQETARRMAQEVCPMIRADEVYWSERTILPNSAACAAPIFDAQGDLIAVVGVSIYRRGSDKPARPDIVAGVKEAGARASQALGYVPRLRRNGVVKPPA